MSGIGIGIGVGITRGFIVTTTVLAYIERVETDGGTVFLSPLQIQVRLNQTLC